MGPFPAHRPHVGKRPLDRKQRRAVLLAERCKQTKLLRKRRRDLRKSEPVLDDPLLLRQSQREPFGQIVRKRLSQRFKRVRSDRRARGEPMSAEA